jgi:hypothetical protein
MFSTRTGLARRLSAPAVAVLIATAAVLWHHLPVPTQIYAPFDVHGGLGSPVHSRAMTVTATSVRVARIAKMKHRTFRGDISTAAGLWVVVDVTVSSTRTTMTPQAQLLVGVNTYLPAPFGDVNTPTVPIDPGIPQHGSWTFDVANKLIEPSTSKPLQLQVWTGDERLNSRLVIDLDRREPEHVHVVTVQPREVGPA